MKLLNEIQIGRKIERLAIEILENNYNEKEIILAGVNNNGYSFAELIQEKLEKHDAKKKVSLTRINLSPAKPLEEEITIDKPAKELKNKVVIVVDDVANTGRTIFYAFKPLMNVLAKKIEVAVMVDRTHKSFPIKVDYMGMSLATTVEENIEVRIRGKRAWAVFLK
ncbi:MAG: pyrimidine operon attenuation protein/uracil phosphoribosyltransferase [Polaribacter sp.]|jgi:pyrimidine operon attenuation protein/uracil phosphoribosyltransferase